MRVLKFYLTSVWILLPALTASADPLGRTYRVQPGDTLSDILERLGWTPMYGKRGSLQKVVRENPRSVSKYGDLIRPGVEIYFSGAPSESADSASTSGSDPAVVPSPATEAEPIANSGITVPPKVVDEEPEPFSRLKLSARTSYFLLESRVKATGANAELSTGLAPGFDLAWQQLWSSQWRTEISLGSSSLRYNPPADRTLAGNSLQLSRLEARADWSFLPRWASSFIIGSEEMLFIRALSTTQLQLDQRWLPGVGAGLQYSLVTGDSVNAGLRASYTFLPAISSEIYRTKLGARTGVSGFVTHESKHWGIFGEPFYRRTKTSTEVLDDELREIGVRLGASFRW